MLCVFTGQANMTLIMAVMLLVLRRPWVWGLVGGLWGGLLLEAWSCVGVYSYVTTPTRIFSKLLPVQLAAGLLAIIVALMHLHLRSKTVIECRTFDQQDRPSGEALLRLELPSGLCADRQKEHTVAPPEEGDTSPGTGTTQQAPHPQTTYPAWCRLPSTTAHPASQTSPPHPDKSPSPQSLAASPAPAASPPPYTSPLTDRWDPGSRDSPLP